MDALLWDRVFAAFLVDGSVAVVCGLLLAERWLVRVAGVGSPSCRGWMKVFAGLLCLGSWCQLILLAVTFGGESEFHAVMAILPDVCGTHAGGVLLATCVVAALLFAATWIVPGRLQNGVYGVLALSFLGLHGAVGHAAVDGIFSWSEGLQWVHLLGMALWSGGVLVSGLLVVPGMSSGGWKEVEVRRYLGLLSALSTWCVALVLLSGAVKGYRTTGGIALLRSSYWGQVLLLKVVVVIFTVGLGARNRWLLGSSSSWDKAVVRRATRTLRAESICMAGVLLLSAWLANSPLPME